jgi:hypothetical protein
MPKLNSGIFTMTPDWKLDVREAKDFRVDVEFSVNQQTAKEWIFRIGVDLKYNIDPEVFKLLGNVAGRDGSVQIDFKERKTVWHPLAAGRNIP